MKYTLHNDFDDTVIEFEGSPTIQMLMEDAYLKNAIGLATGELTLEEDD